MMERVGRGSHDVPSVCMHACMHVCMYVCMRDGKSRTGIAWCAVGMYVCIHLHVCMYVCMYL